MNLDVLMARHQSGDGAAFADLFDHLSPRLYRFLVRALRDPSLAEDLVQTTFLKMHKSRGQYRPGKPVVGWAFAIARNAMLDALRKRKRRPEDLTHDGSPPRVTMTSTPFDTVANAALLERALDALSPEQREVILLHKVEGLSMNELAGVLEITPGNARIRAHRGYKAVAAFLEEQTA